MKNSCLKIILIVILLLSLSTTQNSSSCLKQESVSLIVPERYAKDEGITLVEKSLNEVLPDYNILVSSDNAVTTEVLPSISVIIGKENRILKELQISFEPDLGEEDYQIKSMELDDKIVFAIAGGSIKGDLYGCFYLINKIKTSGTIPGQLNITKRPSFPIRMISGVSPEDALKSGYNTIYYNGCFGPSDVTVTTLCKEFEKRLVPEKTELYNMILKNREIVRKVLKRTKALHLDYVAGGDEPQYPASIKLIPQNRFMFTEDNGIQNLNFNSTFSWNYIRNKYREFFNTFPGVDYCFVKTGENHAGLTHPFFSGNTLPDREKKEIVSGLIDEITQIVINGNNKKYIHAMNGITLPSPELFSGIVNNYLNNPQFAGKMFFIIKEHDAELLSLSGNRGLIFEKAVPGKHEGKGIFPQYTGEKTARLFEELRKKNTTGIWCNYRAGAGSGPITRNAMWNEVNLYVASRLLWEPEVRHEDIAKEWAVWRFGNKAAGPVTQILSLSEKTARNLCYINEKEMESVFDNQQINGEEFLKKLYEKNRGTINTLMSGINRNILAIEEMAEIIQTSEEEIERSGKNPEIDITPDLYYYPAPEILHEHRYFVLEKPGILSYSEKSVLASNRIIPADVFGVGCLLKGTWKKPEKGQYKTGLSFTYTDPDFPDSPPVRTTDTRLNHTINIGEKEDNEPVKIDYRFKDDYIYLKGMFYIKLNFTAGEAQKVSVKIIALENEVNQNTFPRANAYMENVELVFINVKNGKEIRLPLYRSHPERQTLYEYTLNSIKYEHTLAQVLRDYIGAYLLYRNFQKTKNKVDKNNILLYLENWRNNWNYYNTEISGLPGTGTLFNGIEMEKVMEMIAEKINTQSME